MGNEKASMGEETNTRLGTVPLAMSRAPGTSFASTPYYEQEHTTVMRR